MAGMLVTPMQMNDVASKIGVVRAAVVDETEKRAMVAEGVLAAHRDSGDSEILVAFGATDGYFILSDKRGLEAAAAIEYGYDAGWRTYTAKDGRKVRHWVKARRPVGALRAGINYRG